MIGRALQRGAHLDGLPGDGVQVVVAQVQLLQGQQLVEGPLVDEHQLVVVQDEVVQLGHPAEGVVADPGQAVAVETQDGRMDENSSEKQMNRRRAKRKERGGEGTIHILGTKCLWDQ